MSKKTLCFYLHLYMPSYIYIYIYSVCVCVCVCVCIHIHPHVHTQDELEKARHEWEVERHRIYTRMEEERLTWDRKEVRVFIFLSGEARSSL